MVITMSRMITFCVCHLMPCFGVMFPVSMVQILLVGQHEVNKDPTSSGAACMFYDVVVGVKQRLALILAHNLMCLCLFIIFQFEVHHT